VGDVLQLYINDEFFAQPTQENTFLKLYKPHLDIVYEDENILLVNKRPGVVVHADETEKVHTLINNIQAYLYQKKEWNPNAEHSFAPALCNRIDRNTGGIVIAAKTAEALRVMNQKIRDRELTKLYLCVILGRMTPGKGKLESYIFKDEAKKQVYVRKTPCPGAKTAVTLYRTLATKNNLSLVECDLITGRTHQIRAQFAAAGHPLLGDGKYGSGQQNKQYDRKGQALYSYKLKFNFTTDAGNLAYLDGMEWKVEDIDFVEEYFPEFGK
jgi:23S rRNA pseudouridine955/2504/2580 synthase